MIVRRYQAPLDRHQGMLLPTRVEDYVSSNNPVRAIDAYVDSLDLQALGFINTQPVVGAVGQPPYDPAGLLKRHICMVMAARYPQQPEAGSWKLEAGTRDASEPGSCLWLMEGLQPSYRTIADFRQKNSAALKAVKRDFVLVWKELALLGGEMVAGQTAVFSKPMRAKRAFTRRTGLTSSCKHGRQENYRIPGSAGRARCGGRACRARQFGGRRTAERKASSAEGETGREKAIAATDARPRCTAGLDARRRCATTR